MNGLIKVLGSFLLLVAWLGKDCQADLILQFESTTFDQVQGTDFVVGVDRIRGVVVFDAAGSSFAKAITLSATMNGAKTFEFNVPDASRPDPGITIGTNSFTNWSGNLPTSWDVTIFGNIAGAADEEQISIHSTFGDLAAFDFLGPQPQVGITLLPGSFSAVPEPHSAIFVTMSLAAIGWRRRKAAKVP